MSRHGEFFKSLGLQTYVFFDKSKNTGNVTEIEATFDRSWKLKQASIEKLLEEEIPVDVLHDFLESTSHWDDYPSGSKFEYDPVADDTSVRKVCFKVLRVRKGARYAEALIELCSKSQLPAVIVEALLKISNDLPNQLPLDEETEEDEAAEASVGDE